MNSPLTWLLILVGGFFLVRAVQDNGGGGGELPKSVLGLQLRAKNLERKVVILITGSDWCPACQSMERGLLASPEWAAFTAKEVVFQKYDYPNGGEASTAAHRDLLKLDGFEGFPTLVVADGGGKILGMRAGYGLGTDYPQWIRSL
jgi:thiol-disulfide isomerase/thioredoxin